MVHRLLVAYGRPEDPAAFDQHYRDVHTGLAQQIPGLLRLTIGHVQSTDGSQSPFHLIAELDFESEEAMGAAMGSPAGKAAGDDVPTFASGGATMAHFEVQDVTPS